MVTNAIAEIEAALVAALESIHSLKSGEKIRYSSLRDLEIQLRKMRYIHFPRGYFSDVAWDILLDLDKFAESGAECAITDIGVESRIPLATILRYLSKLENDGFIRRTPDKRDLRRSIVSLTDDGRRALDRTFAGALNRNDSQAAGSALDSTLQESGHLETAVRHTFEKPF
jgi:DNA-binding MarR family transcriptional regulator